MQNISYAIKLPLVILLALVLMGMIAWVVLMLQDVDVIKEVLGKAHQNKQTGDYRVDTRRGIN